MNEIQHRFCDYELRAIERDGKQTIEGYAVVFDQLSKPLGYGQQFVEKIDRRAFGHEIGNDVVALWEHDTKQPLGRRSAGTLELEIDDKGVKYRIDPPKTSYAADLLESISRGDVKHSSFGFRVLPDGETWTTRKNGPSLRTIVKARLEDVSPVTLAAYEQTSVDVSLAVRSAREAGILLSTDERQGAGPDPLKRFRDRQRLAELLHGETIE